MSERRYRVRYYVEVGDFTVHDTHSIPLPGSSVAVVSPDNWGYAVRDLFVASIGDKTIALASTQGVPPPRDMLVAVRNMIDHLLEEHVP